MTKIYHILLDNKKIGTTEFEKADAPTGVVFGKINLLNIESGYQFFKTYCQRNNVKIVTDYPNDKLITTSNIPNLKVINQLGTEIKGQGTNIEGMDSDIFEVTIVGVPYPFYEEEFPYHVNAYKKMFL